MSSGNTSPEKKPILISDIDAFLIDPREINAHWLPGEPSYLDLPADESAMAEAYGMNLQEFYRKKDKFLNSSEAILVPPIKDSPEVLGLVAIRFEIIFASARVPNVHDSTLAWLEENYGNAVGNLQEELKLFTIGSEKTHYLDSKEAIYRAFSAEAMTDDKRQHHIEGKKAGVATRIYYQDSRLGGESRSGATPEGSHLATNFQEVKAIILPPDYSNGEDTPKVTSAEL
ncbi:MAG: hypothetical protein AAB914_02960 [Patescibacteria group bacterium]